MDDSAIAILTRESVAEIVQSGGTGNWALKPRRARATSYVVCVRNDRNEDPDAGERHGTALLVGIVSGMELVGERDGVKRWRVLFDRCAKVAMPDVVWGNWRNPVRYTTLSELGIDPDALRFSLSERANERVEEAADGQEVPSLTILQAKAGLARGLGIRPDQVEITIKA